MHLTNSMDLVGGEKKKYIYIYKQGEALDQRQGCGPMMYSPHRVETKTNGRPHNSPAFLSALPLPPLWYVTWFAIDLTLSFLPLSLSLFSFSVGSPMHRMGTENQRLHVHGWSTAMWKVTSIKHQQKRGFFFLLSLN